MSKLEDRVPFCWSFFKPIDLTAVGIKIQKQNRQSKAKPLHKERQERPPPNKYSFTPHGMEEVTHNFMQNPRGNLKET